MPLLGGTRRLRLGLRFGRTGALLLALQCTPLSDFEVHQCETHADCDMVGSSVMRCEAARCLTGCADNAHCESVDPRSPLCEDTGGGCVGLSTNNAECYASVGYDPTTMGSLTLSQMLVVGVLSPTLRSSSWLSVQLAIDEINSLGGLPGGSSARPVLAVLCDTSTPERLQVTIRHLIQNLHVKTILAPLDDAALRAVVGQPSTKGQALFLSPNGADPWNGAEPDADSRVLYLGAEYGDALPAYGPVLDSAVASVFARGKNAETLRVALAVSDSEEDSNLAAALRSRFSIADRTFDELEREYQAATFRAEGDQWPVDAIAAYAPDLVLVFAGGSSQSSPYRSRAAVIDELEQRVTGSTWQPLYVISPRTGSDVGLARLAQANPSFRSRSVTLSADRPVDEAASSSLAGRFASAFPVAFEPELVRGLALEMYAGVYYLAYAAAATPDGEAGAAGLVAGMSRITDLDAERVDIGPGSGGFGRAVELLRAGATFNLLGASGEADFNERTGARPGVPRALCWLEDGVLSERARSVPDSAPELELVPLDCAEEIFDAVAK